MDRVLAVLYFLLALAMIVFAFPEGTVAVLAVTVCIGYVILFISFFSPENKGTLIKLFLVALLVRLVFGLIVHVLDLREFFGGDAITYDIYGFELSNRWFGEPLKIVLPADLDFRISSIGWGMTYLVAGIYSILGRNILAAQSMVAVIGAAIAPLVYVCANRIFKNNRVGLYAAILVTGYPAFIIWTSQLIKDGPIIFLLVLSMTSVISLQKKFNYFSLATLFFSLFGIISLRFYIFYLLVTAILGSFLISLSSSPQVAFRRMLILLVIAFGLTYMGIFRYGGVEIERVLDLKTVNRARQDLSARADSGFGKDLDVSTPEGAISTIPIGFVYVMFAPFPWQIDSFRQLVTLPDMMIWWASLPLLLSGLIYSIKKRLWESMAILIFTLLLTIAYSIFQGNVGTAYRQRAQIQVFLFIFVSVGWNLYLERKENRKMSGNIQKQAFEQKLRENATSFKTNVQN